MYKMTICLLAILAIAGVASANNSDERPKTESAQAAQERESEGVKTATAVLAITLNAWNPAIDMRRMLDEIRSQTKSSRSLNHILNPLVGLVDASYIVDRQGLAEILVPAIYGIDRGLGNMLSQRLGVPVLFPIRFQSGNGRLSYSALEQGLKAYLPANHGTYLPALGSGSKVSSIADAFSGPGSFLARDIGRQRDPLGRYQKMPGLERRAPIGQHSREAYASCFNSCMDKMGDYAGKYGAVGGAIGGGVGAVGGAVAGGIAGGAAGGVGAAPGAVGGAAAGAQKGAALGGIAGGVVGAGKGLHECMGGSACSDPSAPAKDKTENKDPQPPRNEAPKPAEEGNSEKSKEEKCTGADCEKKKEKREVEEQRPRGREMTPEEEKKKKEEKRSSIILVANDEPKGESSAPSSKTGIRNEEKIRFTDDYLQNQRNDNTMNIDRSALRNSVVNPARDHLGSKSFSKPKL